MNYKTKILKIQEATGLNASKFAARVGVAPSTITRVLRSETDSPSPLVKKGIDRLARLYKIE